MITECCYEKCGEKNTGLMVKFDKCRHVFCMNCFMKWFSNRTDCPNDHIEVNHIKFCDNTGFVYATYASEDVFYDMILHSLNTIWVEVQNQIIQKYDENVCLAEEEIKLFKKSVKSDLNKSIKNHSLPPRLIKKIIDKRTTFLTHSQKEFKSLEEFIDYSVKGSVFYHEIKETESKTIVRKLHRHWKKLKCKIHLLSKSVNSIYFKHQKFVLGISNR